MANSELALAIALPVGIVCLLAAFVGIAWMAGRRRRIRTDPIEAAKGAHPSDLQRQLYGIEEAGSVATTLNSSSAGSASALGRSKSLFSKRYSAASSTGGSFRESDLWDLQRDEELDDREWVPLEAGWREQYRDQQQQQQHQSSRRSHRPKSNNGRRGSRGSNNGWVQAQPPYGMPATSSRMSGGMSMALSQSDAGPYPAGSFRPRGSVGSGFSSVSSSGSRGGPPPSTSNNMSMSRGGGGNAHHNNIHGGASSSTLRSLGTVPEVPPFKAGRPLGEATTEAEAEAVHENGKGEAPSAASTPSPLGTMTTTTTTTIPTGEAQTNVVESESAQPQAGEQERAADIGSTGDKSEHKKNHDEHGEQPVVAASASASALEAGFRSGGREGAGAEAESESEAVASAASTS